MQVEEIRRKGRIVGVDYEKKVKYNEMKYVAVNVHETDRRAHDKKYDGLWPLRGH